MIRADVFLRLAPRSSRARWSLGILAILALFGAGRECVVRGTLGRAGFAARHLGEASRAILPDGAPPGDPDAPAGAPLELPWLLEPEGLDIPESGAGKDPALPGRRASTSVALGPVPAPVVVLASNVVLSLAERGAVPRGVVRSAAGDLPAGIEILDGGALGIGWFPGDRLILVGGVSVADRASVVRVVLEARARREPVVSATLARRTKEGVMTYQVLVEQPYLAADAAEAPPTRPPVAPEPPLP